jgi:hypothetical protein
MQRNSQPDPSPAAQPEESGKPPVKVGGGNQTQAGNPGEGTGEYEDTDPQWDAEQNPEDDR